MRNEEELKLLYDKFDRDVKEKSRLLRLLIATDQWFNVLIWDGSNDETISSHIHRRIEAGKALWVERLICKGLQKLEKSHCFKSRGE